MSCNTALPIYKITCEDDTLVATPLLKRYISMGYEYKNNMYRDDKGNSFFENVISYRSTLIYIVQCKNPLHYEKEVLPIWIAHNREQKINELLNVKP